MFDSRNGRFSKADSDPNSKLPVTQQEDPLLSCARDLERTRAHGSACAKRITLPNTPLFTKDPHTTAAGAKSHDPKRRSRRTRTRGKVLQVEGAKRAMSAPSLTSFSFPHSSSRQTVTTSFAVDREQGEQQKTAPTSSHCLPACLRVCVCVCLLV